MRLTACIEAQPPTTWVEAAQTSSLYGCTAWRPSSPINAHTMRFRAQQIAPLAMGQRFARSVSLLESGPIDLTGTTTNHFVLRVGGARVYLW